ncbi:phage distal tail protein [Sediminibacillus halophilus]|uniref:Phage tail protein n=1 Tax=Sediminibacillus halophilus TaxID=482461 RepID=A0A1G9QUC1_9BACI|nr:phage tail domain-containing protein [Sediminibacillus halophilus]SDM14606.1 Phage tail protein [Sediminibacillus halophilus]
MRRITYENARGEEIVFYLSPLVIESLTGIGEVDAEVQGQKSPYQDGDTYIDSLLQARYIDLHGKITKTKLSEIKQLRKEIIRVCNPKLGLGKIVLELDGDVKEIEGVLESVPTFPEKRQNPFQEFLVSWKCPDPYWKDPQEVSRALKAYEGKFTFPFNFPVEFGIEGDSTSIYNEGDVETPVQINIQGPVSNPMVKNRTTGDYIRIWRTLSADEVLHIDTNQQNKRVEIYLNGSVIQKAWGYLDDYSELFKLIPGQNKISYVADSSTDNAIASIAWKNRYVGI